MPSVSPSLENVSKAIDEGNADNSEFLERMMPWSPEYREYEEKTKQRAMNSFKDLFPDPIKPKTPLKRKQPADFGEDQLDNTA